MYSRIIQCPRDRSFFLFGPRGTGKTTWIRQHFPDAVYIDLLQSEEYFRLSASPQRLDGAVPHGWKGWVIIDEIQKIPELLDEVHRLIENRRLKFILTGSSARKLRRRGVNLLAGRALTRQMFPLTACELRSDFDLKRSLQYGHLPTAYTDNDPAAYLASYVSTYLREEVIQEGILRNFQAFTRFMEAASFAQASVLNISETARECGVSRKTVEGYFQILYDLLLAVRITPFTRRARRRLISHVKFYYFDAGVYRAIRPRGPLDTAEEIDGSALETLILQELMAVNHYFDLGYSVHFWRTTTGAEVDFVLYGPKGIKAIEAKRSPTPRKKDARGLKIFLKDYPMADAMIFYGGQEERYDFGVTWIPVTNALRNLPRILAGENRL